MTTVISNKEKRQNDTWERKRQARQRQERQCIERGKRTMQEGKEEQRAHEEEEQKEKDWKWKNGQRQTFFFNEVPTRVNKSNLYTRKENIHSDKLIKTGKIRDGKAVILSGSNEVCKPEFSILKLNKCARSYQWVQITMIFLFLTRKSCKIWLHLYLTSPFINLFYWLD